ncbi:MAG: SEC-C metal-binding domain-containing protein, partial [Planctomycetota bacterium]
SKGIEKAQKKVEERNFEIRKSLLEYDEVMDYQRNVFYSRRRSILAGKELKQIIEEMIDSAIAYNCETILSKNYPARCILEWARTNFNVDLKESDVTGISAEEIEKLIKEQKKDNAANDISLSMGEYLEDYDDARSWDIAGLCKWAMSAFSVSLSAGKIKHQSPEEIEEQLISAAAEQIDKKDCSQLIDFLKEDFAVRTFAEWARAKFDIRPEIEQLKSLNAGQIRQLLKEQTAAKYRQREIEYPVEFAMNMAYGPQGANIYGFEALADWANKKYNAGLSAEQIQNVKPRALHKQLLELSESFNDGQLDKELDSKVERLSTSELVNWANERFSTSLTEDELPEGAERREKLAEAGREFLRSELSDLEKYVLLQIYDSTWKDHLYAMDKLKDGIWMRSFAEKDPKIEYKREGYRLFDDMLQAIEDRVTDVIFKVRLEAGARARSVWNVSRVAHDEVGQFAMAEQQRAAAQAPQGDVKVKQIRLDQPKVGRNDPCPCGSGKKYKKCCGKNL